MVKVIKFIKVQLLKNWKSKKYHNDGTVPKSDWKIVKF
jgi:hypothetical protein